MASKATLSYHGNQYYGKEKGCATGEARMVPARSCCDTEWAGPCWIDLRNWDTVVLGLGKEP